MIWALYLLHGDPLALNLGPQLAPETVSKGIALALYLGTPSYSRGPLPFDLGPQLAQGTPGSFKEVSLTIDLGTSLALVASWLLIWCPIYLQVHDFRRSPIDS